MLRAQRTVLTRIPMRRRYHGKPLSTPSAIMCELPYDLTGSVNSIPREFPRSDQKYCPVGYLGAAHAHGATSPISYEIDPKSEPEMDLSTPS